MSECGHDGWVAGCPVCEAEHALANELLAQAAGEMCNLYAESGGDVDLCELCETPLYEERWLRGLDGAGAHERCLLMHGIVPAKHLIQEARR